MVRGVERETLNVFLSSWKLRWHFRRLISTHTGVTWFTSPLHLGKCAWQVLQLRSFVLLNTIGMQRRPMPDYAHSIVHYSNGKKETAPKTKLEKHLTGCLGESWHLLFVTFVFDWDTEPSKTPHWCQGSKGKELEITGTLDSEMIATL